MKNDREIDKVIRQILNGENERFGEIVSHFENRVFSIGMRFFRNCDEARDFAQEVFMKAYYSLKDYRGRGKFQYWLSRIAYNHGISTLKKYQESTLLKDEHIESDIRSPEQLYIKNEINILLEKEMKSLPEKYQVSMELYFYMGLSYKEISSITGFPINTIKSNVLRARRQLHSTLKGTIAEDYDEM
jgi:RNA polymerase sigma-70 factor, ECF subfamily